jgi:hypothetical protein
MKDYGGKLVTDFGLTAVNEWRNIVNNINEMRNIVNINERWRNNSTK